MKLAKKRTFDSIQMEGEEFESLDSFTELHNEIYRAIWR